MTNLRDGSTTKDVRLDRLIQFDERSRLFGIAESVESKPLRSRSHPSTLWLDQGQEGACVSFSLHHELGANPQPVKNITDDIAKAAYYAIQKADPWPGGAYPGADPVYEGTSVLSGVKYLQALGYYTEYRWAFNVEEAMQAISHEGPVVFGIPWLDSMFKPDISGLLDCSGAEAGGHAIMGRGVILPRFGRATVNWPGGTISRIKTTEPLIRLRNSWGKDWGRDGEAVIKASDMTRLLNNSGECVVPVGRKIV